MTNTASAQIAEAWRHHRPYLVNLAYQMLGDVGDAEDVAQEAFLRLSSADAGTIEDVRAWLTVVAGRLCLDQVRSARARYERPDDIGAEAVTLNQPGRLNPADRVTLDDEVRTALLEVLRRLSPGERVSFVLHDVFGVPFDAIAETVGRPVGTCRQLARRARAKFALAQPKPGEVSTAQCRWPSTSWSPRSSSPPARTAICRRWSRCWTRPCGASARSSPIRRRPRRSTTVPTMSRSTCCATWARVRRWSAVRPASPCCWPSPSDASSPSSC